MKHVRIMAVSLIALVFVGAGPGENVFHGEISDSQCAMNVHSLSRSHQEMIAKNTFGPDAASCARTCIRRGGEWVLRDGDVVYHLKNQSGVDEWAAQKVRVIGDLDKATNTINNEVIEVERAQK